MDSDKQNQCLEIRPVAEQKIGIKHLNVTPIYQMTVHLKV